MVLKNDTLQFFFHPEGRVVVDGNGIYEYQYTLTDHLGNTRVLFGEPKTESPTATLETADAEQDRAGFLYYDNVTRINSYIFDKTNQAETKYSMRLNGTEEERTGLAKSLAVAPGDVVRATVHAKYLDPDQNNWSTALTDLMNAIASGASGVVTEGAPVASGQEFPFAGLLGKTTDANEAPEAYLNLLVFDKDFNFLDGAFQRMTEVAREDGSDVPHEMLTLEWEVQEAGYVYIYLSNNDDAPREVYFDDFNVTHEQTPVIQSNSYYPFGLQHGSSWTRPEALPNAFLYNAGSELNQHTGNYETFFRQYDPALGRMSGIDIMAGKYSSLTPYHYAFNDPVAFNDPSGADPDDEG